MNKEYDFTDEIAYVVKRANAEGSVPRYLEKEYGNARSIDELVSDIIILNEKLLDTEYEKSGDYFSDDAREYISKETGYSVEIIELVLWFYECFLMENDRIDFCEICPNCGHDVLYLREDSDEMFCTFVECGKCNMIFGFEEFEEEYYPFFEFDFDEILPISEEKRMTMPAKDVNKTNKSKTNKSYIIKAATGYRNGIWRKIQISAAATLDDLSDAVLSAFEFDDDHLYAFYMDQKLRTRGVPTFYSPRCNNGSDSADRYILAAFGFQPKQKFLYLYDFGDCWNFIMTFEKEIDETTPVAFVVDSRGEAPAQYWNEEDEYDEDEYDEDEYDEDDDE